MKNLKRILVTIMSFVLVFCLTSCDSSSSSANKIQSDKNSPILGYSNADTKQFTENNYDMKFIGYTTRNIPTGYSTLGYASKFPVYGNDTYNSTFTDEEKTAIDTEQKYLNPYYATSSDTIENDRFASMDSKGNLYNQNGELLDQKFFRHIAAETMNYGGLSDSERAVIKEFNIKKEKLSNGIDRHYVTGLYAPAGEIVEIKISDEDLKSLGGQFKITIGQTDTQGNKVDIEDHNKVYRKMPSPVATYVISSTTAYVGSYLGGAIYIHGLGNKWENLKKDVKITISGAVEYQHFIYGLTTEKDYQRYYNSTAPYIELSVQDRVRFNGPLKYAKDKDGNNFSYDNMVKVADLWYKIASTSRQFPNNANIKDIGIDSMFDQYVRKDTWSSQGGIAVKGASFCSNPASWIAGALDYDQIMTNADFAWGDIHEFNHHYQGGFGLPNGAEVTNNADSLLEFALYTNASAYRRDNKTVSGWSRYTDAAFSLKDTLNRTGKQTDLNVYATLIHSMTREQFINGLTIYDEANNKWIDSSGENYYVSNSLAMNRDLTYFFENILNYPISSVNKEKVQSQNLKMFIPAAIIYQTGRGFDDGNGNIVYNSTMTPYVLDDLSPKTIDFNTQLVLPSGFTFKIKNISFASTNVINYNKIEKVSENVYTYIPSSKNATSGKINVDIEISNPNVDFELEDIHLQLEFSHSEIDANTPKASGYYYVPTTYYEKQYNYDNAEIVSINQDSLAGKDASKIIDNDTSTYYTSNKNINSGNPFELIIDYNTDIYANKIRMYYGEPIAAHNTIYYKHIPQAFKIYLGDSLDNMQLYLDETNNGSSSNAAYYTINLNKIIKFRYLKIEVTDTRFEWVMERYVSIAEFQFFYSYNKNSVDSEDVYYSNDDWERVKDYRASYSHYYQSNGGKIIMYITGNYLIINSFISQDLGTLYISIDNGKEFEVNISSNKNLLGASYISHDLGSGDHVVKIRSKGLVNIESYGTYSYT